MAIFQFFFVLPVLVAVIAPICKVKAVNGIPQVGHEGHTTCCWKNHSYTHRWYLLFNVDVSSARSV